MISPSRQTGSRSFGAAYLVLLATGASFAAAALLLGPGGSGGIRLPAVVDRERQGKRAAGWPGLDRRADSNPSPPDRRKPRYEGRQRRAGRRTAHGRPRREGWHPFGQCHHPGCTGQPVNDIRDLAKQIALLGSGWHGESHDLAEGVREDHLADARGEMPKQNERVQPRPRPMRIPGRRAEARFDARVCRACRRCRPRKGSS